MGILNAQSRDSSYTNIQKEILKTRKTSIKAFPYAFYTPETQLAFGVGGIITFYTSKARILRPSKVTLSGYYSTNAQYKITLSPQLFLAQNSIFTSLNLNFGRYVDKFWGIGNNTSETGNEQYVAKAWDMILDFQFPPLLKFAPQDKSGLRYDFNNYNITDPEDNSFLTNDLITGSEGGISSGLGLVFVWDNRNQIFYPTGGGFYQAKFTYFAKALGSDFNFNSYEIDLRQYVGLKNQQVLAWQVFANFASGNPPFYELPALGGANIMRGYFKGRYRDKSYLASQVEYRRHLWWRVGAIAFFGIGGVAPALKDFQLREFKTSYGFGLRFLFNQDEKVNIRADFGFGREVSGVYFGLEEAF
jgi:hypothetical protein